MSLARWLVFRSLPSSLAVIRPSVGAVVAWAAMAASLLVVGGCGLSGPTEFPLNLQGRDPASVSLAQREALTETLARLFGTPDQPRVPEGSGLDLNRLQAAAGPVASDAAGNQRGLFRQHCAGCHGIAGDGVGPSASLLNPYPRDFRLGVFKYTSTLPGVKPTGDDLRQTLLRGIPGTAMPSFARLADADLDALVEYIKYLSIRGETERSLVQLVVDEDEYLPLDMELVRSEALEPVVEAWREPGTNPKLVVAPPPPRPPTDAPAERLASIARGRELYAKKDAQCVKCHGPSGKGDGEQTDIYDDWNKPKVGVSAADTADLARWYALPVQELRPRDFTKGVFRGGSRPEDLYMRIAVGIKGTPMPGVGPAPGVKPVMTPAEIWDVVNYIRSLRR